MDIETLDTLDGEGEILTVKQIRRRRECAYCDEPAHFKVTFLLNNFRSNPASSGYRKDDCSYCEDAHEFVCRKHRRNSMPPEGYCAASVYPATKIWSHLFLYWEGLQP